MKEVAVGDEVVLVGHQGDEAITIEETADALSSMTALISLSFTACVPRVNV